MPTGERTLATGQARGTAKINRTTAVERRELDCSGTELRLGTSIHPADKQQTMGGCGARAAEGRDECPAGGVKPGRAKGT